MFLPGQPSTPGTTYEKFNFGQVAAQAIDSGKAAPFVGVIPPLMTNAPRDTECTDIPGGPQAETYLANDVPTALQHSFRVAPLGSQWTLAGWSTGAFCAAKLALAHPHAFGSAITFGGYFQPVTDRTTGDLFHGNRALEHHNSPIWLYTHVGSQGLRMLFIAGRQDHEAWPATNRMLRMTTGNPDVSFIAFPTGGHNFRNYRSYLGQALQWARPAGSA